MLSKPRILVLLLLATVSTILLMRRRVQSEQTLFATPDGFNNYSSYGSRYDSRYDTSPDMLRQAHMQSSCSTVDRSRSIRG